MSELSPQERWEEGIDHHPESIEVKKIIRQYDKHGIYEFGGDGDNGEDFLYYLDVYFERREKLNEFNNIKWCFLLESGSVMRLSYYSDKGVINHMLRKIPMHWIEL